MILQPKTWGNGGVRWTWDVVFVHFLWVWQVGVAVLLDIIVMVFWETRYHGLEWLLRIFAPTSFLLTIIIIAEVCAFASNLLTRNSFFFLELGKTIYVAAVFILLPDPFPSKDPDEGVNWTFLVVGVISLIPWVVALEYAVAVKLNTEETVLEDEESPLLGPKTPVRTLVEI